MIFTIVRLLTTALLLMSAQLTWASRDPCPPATRENIFGIWEAVDLPQAFRIFRLELNRKGISTLTEGMPEPTYIPAFGSVLTALELDDDGRIVIELKTVHTSMIGQRLNVEGNTYVTTGIERLEGFARVCEDSNTGVLNAKLTVEPTRPDPRTWNLIFYKTSAKTLAETITIMEKHAVELADRLRRGEPVPPFPGVAP